PDSRPGGGANRGRAAAGTANLVGGKPRAARSEVQPEWEARSVAVGSSQGNDSQSQRTGRVWADRGRLRMMAGAGLLRSVLIGAVIVLVKYGPGLGDADRYRVTLDEIHVTEPPDWVRADVATLKSQAAELAELDLPLDLQQPKVTVEVAEAFRRHP